jgi:Pyruvate/2-oxoacid:ferredoxin oxidoreductase delta subunit
MKKKPEKTKAELEREERQYKESLERIKRESAATLAKWCSMYNLDFEAPFSCEEADEILKVARGREVEEIEKLFPGFKRYAEDSDMQINCKLCFKFHLDPKIVADRPAIMKAISYKLNKGVSDSAGVNPELHKFKKN